MGITFDKDMMVVDRKTFQTTRDGIFVGGDAAWGPENIIWAVEHGHQAAISIHAHCERRPIAQRPRAGMTLASTKMGLHEWSYSNDYHTAQRQRMRHVELGERLAQLTTEVELGFTPEQTAVEVERCLNCDVQTAFIAGKCIECDACLDACPMDCLTIVDNAPEEKLRHGGLRAPAKNPKQALYASEALVQTGRIMVKDEDLCLHCGLCAERCPTDAWDMAKFDLRLPYAGQEVA
jgi:ferredoxin